MFSPELRKRTFLDECRNSDGAHLLLQEWEDLPHNPIYARYARAALLMKGTFNPLPDVEPFELIIRRAGHEFAAHEVLQKSNWWSLLVRGTSATWETYHGLRFTVSALLTQGEKLFDHRDVELLYSTMDRLLQGGKDWANMHRVPAATKEFYQTLTKVKLSVPLSITGHLNSIIRPDLIAKFGEDFEVPLRASLGVQDLLSVAATAKNGRSKTTIEDAMEGAWAYLALFDADIRSLPLVERVGRSGYEKE